jgi:hypothetical protein
MSSPPTKQGTDGAKKGQQVSLRALCPPPRGTQPIQGPHHEGEIRPGRLQQVALRHVRPPAQPGPARPTRLADMGEGAFHPLRTPAMIALAERPQPARPVLVEGDGCRGPTAE